MAKPVNPKRPPQKASPSARPGAAPARARALPSPDKVSKPARKPSRQDNPVEIIIERSEVIQGSIKTIKRLCFFVGGLAAVAMLSTCYAIQKKAEPVYFQADEAGNLTRMIPLTHPNHSHPAVGQWLTDALVDTFDFHHGNVNQRLNRAAGLYFTAGGGDALINTWESAGNYDAIVSRGLFVSLAVEHTPFLIEHGPPPGSHIYRWRFQVPAVLTFRNQGEEFTNRVVFTVDVSRRSLLEDPKGLGISRILMRVQR